MFGLPHNLVRFAGLTLTLAAVVPATGQLIAYDGFAYAPSTALNAVGNTGTGWLGSWNSSGPGLWMIDSIGSTYSSGNLSLVCGGKRLFDPFGGAANSQRTMNVSPPLGLGGIQTIWVSFIAQQTWGPAATTWLGVKLPCTVAPGVNQFLFLGKPYNETFWGTDAGSLSSHRMTTVKATSKAFYVARIDLRGGPMLDDVRVWINPGLATTPANNTANLTLLNYGDFEGITKVLAEIGGPMHGNLDEIRIGSDFRSVAPISSGIIYNGLSHNAIGDAQISLPDDEGKVRVDQLGPMGNDGVEIACDSRSGSGVAIYAGDLPSGASLKTSELNWNSDAMGNTSLTRLANGNYRAAFAYQEGMPSAVTSVRLTAFDGNNAMVSDSTVPGSIASIDLTPAMMDLPCPDGRHRYWYQSFQIISSHNSATIVKFIWKYGCGEGAINLTKGPRIEAQATLVGGGGTGQAGGGTDAHKKAVTATGLHNFSIASSAMAHAGAMAIGLGDAQLSEACGDANCTPDLLHLTAANIGGTGMDGVEVVMSADVASLEYTLGTSGLTQSVVGELKQALTVQTPAGLARQISATMKPHEDSRIELALDAGQFQNVSIDVSVSNDGVHAGSSQGSSQSMRIFIDGMEIYSEFMLRCYLRYLDLMGWSMIAPNGSDPFTVTIDNGGELATYVGNELNFEIHIPEPVVSFDRLTVTGKDLSDGIIDITSLRMASTATSCRADFDQDGTVDFFDYDAFVSAFESGATNADFDQDGTIDFFDYDAFVNAFELGC